MQRVNFLRPAANSCIASNGAVVAKTAERFVGRLYLSNTAEEVIIHGFQWVNDEEVCLPTFVFGVPDSDPRSPLPRYTGRLKKDETSGEWRGLYKTRTPHLDTPPLKLHLVSRSALHLHGDDGRRFLHLEGYVSLGLTHEKWLLRGLLAGPAKSLSVDPADW